MSAPRHARCPVLTSRLTRACRPVCVCVAGAVAEVMGNADLVRCILGHVLAGRKKKRNARALARAASGGWTRVSRTHWDACKSANEAWAAHARRHFGRSAPTLVPDDARANFFALCRKAQYDHMGLPVFMWYVVEDEHTLAEAMTEHIHGDEYFRSMHPVQNSRVRSWRMRSNASARQVMRLLTWHPHGKYAPYDLEGMLAYFRSRDDIGPPGTTEAYPFYTSAHKMGAFLYPAHVTDWQSLEADMPKNLSARKYLSSVHLMNEMLQRFRADCA